MKRHKMKAIYVGLLLGVMGVIPSYGQGVSYARRAEKMNRIVDEWMEGEVTFKDGETILCRLSYNPLVPEGLLKISDGDKIITSTAFDIESFTCYDYDASIDHTYVSFPVTKRNRVFAQLLYEGSRYALLGRKSARITKEYWNTDPRTYSTGSYFGTRIKPYYQYVLFSFATSDFQVLTRKDLLRITADRKQEVKAFIRANRLKFRHTEDYVAVLREYERLIE